ncbi:MAG: hypothetical protein K2M79_03015 [Muribaculaceae bacterium]|nr:hypothetical protein [Muribaculaceae bacterium]
MKAWLLLILLSLVVPGTHARLSVEPGNIHKEPAVSGPALNETAVDSIFFAEKIKVRGAEPVDSGTSDAVADDNVAATVKVSEKDVKEAGMARVKKLRMWGGIMAGGSAVCIAGGVCGGLFGLADLCMTSGDADWLGIAGLIACPVLVSVGIALGILSYKTFRKANELKLSLKPSQITDLSFTGKNRVTPALTISLNF